MTGHPLPLSQETLAQFNRSLGAESGGPAGPARKRLGSISTCRSSKDQTKDQLHPRRLSLLPFRGPAGGCPPLSEASQLSPGVSYPPSPFTRRDSVCVGKRFSFGGWLQGGRVSFSGLHFHLPAQEVRLENTYRIGPDRGGHFSSGRAQRILQATLDSYLDGTVYSAEASGQLSHLLVDLLQCRVKEICPARYKLVVQVLLGQNAGQGLRVASRCLTDPGTDDYAAAVYQNAALVAVATVHAMYCE